MPGGATRGVPRKLFDAVVATGPLVTRYDGTADGQRFLLNVGTTNANTVIATRPIRVVLNRTTYRSHDERPTETRRSVDSQNLRGRFPDNYFKTFPPLAKRGALRLNAPALLPRRLCEQTATVRAYGRCRAGEP